MVATRKKVNDDEANGIAQLEKDGMQVVKQVNGASFRDATKPAYANYAKEFGADKIAASRPSSKPIGERSPWTLLKTR